MRAQKAKCIGGNVTRAAELLLPQGCLRITPTFEREDACCPIRVQCTVAPELATIQSGLLLDNPNMDTSLSVGLH